MTPAEHRWTPAAEPGDLLWCRFPELQGVKKPGPKSRPALVLASWEEEIPQRVRVAYGTSRKLQQLYPWEFAITLEGGEAFGLSGLTWPTKFDLRHVVDLPYTARWFSAAPDAATPKLGRLHASLGAEAYRAYQSAMSQCR